jgi:hypothetical protein
MLNCKKTVEPNLQIDRIRKLQRTGTHWLISASICMSGVERNVNQLHWNMHDRTGRDANKHDTRYYIPYIFKPLYLVKRFLFFNAKVQQYHLKRCDVGHTG